MVKRDPHLVVDHTTKVIEKMIEAKGVWCPAPLRFGARVSDLRFAAIPPIGRVPLHLPNTRSAFELPECKASQMEREIADRRSAN